MVNGGARHLSGRHDACQGVLQSPFHRSRCRVMMHVRPTQLAMSWQQQRRPQEGRDHILSGAAVAPHTPRTHPTACMHAHVSTAGMHAHGSTRALHCRTPWQGAGKEGSGVGGPALPAWMNQQAHPPHVHEKRAWAARDAESPGFAGRAEPRAPLAPGICRSGRWVLQVRLHPGHH